MWLPYWYDFGGEVSCASRETWTLPVWRESLFFSERADATSNCSQTQRGLLTTSPQWRSIPSNITRTAAYFGLPRDVWSIPYVQENELVWQKVTVAGWGAPHWTQWAKQAPSRGGQDTEWEYRSTSWVCREGNRKNRPWLELNWGGMWRAAKAFLQVHQQQSCLVLQRTD